MSRLSPRLLPHLSPVARLLSSLLLVVALMPLTAPRLLQAEPATKTPRLSFDRPGPGLETAVLAGGCFWGMEELLRKVPGVLQTEVGYTGGRTSLASYEDVKTGQTGHAESVRLIFDPKKLSYEELLRSWFFRMHDPTTRNQQGNDVGSQYRSAIFVTTPAQRKVALAVKTSVDKSGKWKAPVVTEITAAGPFFRAEDYHQAYLVKNPDGYTCHYLRD